MPNVISNNDINNMNVVDLEQYTPRPSAQRAYLTTYEYIRSSVYRLELDQGTVDECYEWRAPGTALLHTLVQKTVSIII